MAKCFEKCFVTFFTMAKAFDTVWIDSLFYQLYGLGIRGKTWRILYRCWILNVVKGSRNMFRIVQIYQFLISHIEDLSSLLHYPWHWMQSTPVGYADDLAASCLKKSKSWTLCLVTGACTWRFTLKEWCLSVLGIRDVKIVLILFFSEFRLSPDKV